MDLKDENTNLTKEMAFVTQTNVYLYDRYYGIFRERAKWTDKIKSEMREQRRVMNQYSEVLAANAQLREENTEYIKEAAQRDLEVQELETITAALNRKIQSLETERDELQKRYDLKKERIESEQKVVEFNPYKENEVLIKIEQPESPQGIQRGRKATPTGPAGGRDLHEPDRTAYHNPGHDPRGQTRRIGNGESYRPRGHDQGNQGEENFYRSQFRHPKDTPEAEPGRWVNGIAPRGRDYGARRGSDGGSYRGRGNGARRGSDDGTYRGRGNSAHRGMEHGRYRSFARAPPLAPSGRNRSSYSRRSRRM